ncbi:hypothetical protein ABI59_05935 [Acidobacteria bacterium Mor1]|nr:hypothetical protein ABI59_05935 [Acidobacteria bacterium Mor1]
MSKKSELDSIDHQLREIVLQNPSLGESYLRMLEANPAAYERMRNRVREHNKRAAGLEERLRALGIKVASIAGLSGVSKTDYRRALPLLLEELPRASASGLKASIVSVLNNEWARPDAIDPLIQEFARDEDQSLAWAIGNALSVIADDSGVPAIVELVREPKFGSAREMLCVALGNAETERPLAVETLMNCLADESLAGHAVMGLGRLKAVEAVDAVRKLESHKIPWIRKEVESFLKSSHDWR